MASVRPPAVAGTFYPGSAHELEAQLENLLGIGNGEPRLGFPKALIVPHAGYVYSGRVAARAYESLSPVHGIVRRVVMLGPAHRVAVRGLAVPGAQGFATPLGEVTIDRQALESVADLPQVVLSDRAHALEHSLEVQLPFLQKLLGRFTLAPLAVGEASAAEVGEVLERLWGGPETLIVVSTDLSHYHAYEEAKRLDGATMARLRSFATDIEHEEACGATPLNGLMRVAGAKGLSMQFLAACNSGDAGGGRREVVGYCAFALYEEKPVSREDAGRTLVSIARGSIESTLFNRAAGVAEGSWLAQAAATFVTLVRGGRLRGCIGSLDPVRALAVDVAENARSAAFRDPRFPALSGVEWSECRVEISLLARPRRLRFADEDDLLAQICAGEDGVIVECGGAAGDVPAAGMGELFRQANLHERAHEESRPSAEGRAHAVRGVVLQGRHVDALKGHPGKWWHRLSDGRIQCDLCPRDCRLQEGQRGLCFVRKRENDAMVLTTYGRSSGFCVDPIEKKPLNHFYPGTSVLSFGTAGCNLACKFCQNWDISKSREMDRLQDEASPEAIAATALRLGCKSVAFTYNDPVIFAEYAMEIAEACRARDVRTVAVTAGYVHPEPRREFFAQMDAANVDLKGFTDEFYYRICGGRLQPVLDTLVYLVKETGVWTEITTLLIPGKNDSDEEIRAECDWIRRHLGADVPLHFTAFHPDWKMTDVPATPAATVARARMIGLRAGLNHVYTGNVHDEEGGTTRCTSCGEALIARDWYRILDYRLDEAGACRTCGERVSGRFEKYGKPFGPKRIPVRIAAAA